jgi:putative transposase
MTAESIHKMSAPRRPRLRRLDEIFVEGPIFFVTFCTLDRKSLLANTTIHDSFRNFGLNARERDNLVGRYVIMPDHLHFFVALRYPETLSMWVKSLKNSLSKTLKTMGQPAPHWQKDFFDHVLRSEESFGSKWDYIQENPVRAGWSVMPRTGLTWDRLTS